MDRQSLARPPREFTTEQEEAHEELLAAARAALGWFAEFDRHAPSDFVFGNEAKIRKRLDRAIRRAS